jgi:hypothetical protein
MKAKREAQEEAEREALEKATKLAANAELATMRRSMVHKPMPILPPSQVVVLSSDKKLTEAMSPQFATKARAAGRKALSNIN